MMKSKQYNPLTDTNNRCQHPKTIDTGTQPITVTDTNIGIIRTGVGNALYAIRPMGVDDLDRVIALEQTLHHEPWTAEQIRDTLNAAHHHRWVITDTSNYVLGYLIALIVADSAEILTCGVDTTHQRCGLATQLLYTLKKTARTHDVTTVFLEVRESNQAARGCYQCIGFQEVGRRRDYYRLNTTREDAIVMAWQIN